MANLNISTLNTLLKEYEKKKFKAELNFEKAKDSFYNSHPDLLELNDKLNKVEFQVKYSV